MEGRTRASHAAPDPARAGGVPRRRDRGRQVVGLPVAVAPSVQDRLARHQPTSRGRGTRGDGRIERPASNDAHGEATPARAFPAGAVPDRLASPAPCRRGHPDAGAAALPPRTGRRRLRHARAGVSELPVPVAGTPLARRLSTGSRLVPSPRRRTVAGARLSPFASGYEDAEPR